MIVNFRFPHLASCYVYKWLQANNHSFIDENYPEFYLKCAERQLEAKVQTLWHLLLETKRVRKKMLYKK